MAIFFNSLQSEWLKRKRTVASWLVVVGGFFIPLIILCSRLIQHQGLSKAVHMPKFWENTFSDCWESMAIFLLPMGIILATSLMMQLEFKNNTWKQLHTTPQGLSNIFMVKYVVLLLMLLQLFLLFTIGVILIGFIPSMIFSGVDYPSAPIPWLLILKKNSLFFIDCLPILALQYLLSLKFKNFMIAIGLGLLLVIASLFALSIKWGFVLPYTYGSFFYMEHLKNKSQLPAYINIHYCAVGYFIVINIINYLLYIRQADKS